MVKWGRSSYYAIPDIVKESLMVALLSPKVIVRALMALTPTQGVAREPPYSNLSGVPWEFVVYGTIAW